MRKENIISPQTSVTTYLDVAYYCTIIFTIPNYQNWYNSKFIKLYTYLSGQNSIKIEYEGCAFPKYFYQDLLDIQFIRHQEITCGILSFLIRLINDGAYVEVSLDEYYLPAKSTFGTTHYLHPTLVYGYDTVRQVVLAVGFHNYQYRQFEIQFDDLQNAYSSFVERQSKKSADLACTIIRVKPSAASCVYNPSLLVDSLRDYLLSIRYDTNIFTWYEDRYEDLIQFGISTYDALIRSMNHPAVYPVDYRSFHLLAEHKRELYKKFTFFNSYYGSKEDEALIAEFHDAVTMSEIVRLKYMKQTMRGSRPDYAFFADALQQLNKKEESVLPRLYEAVAGRLPLHVI